MPDKQKSSPVLKHQANQSEKIPIQIIPQESKFMLLTLTDICDGDLAVTSGEIAYCLQMVRFCDLRFVKK